MIATFDSQKIRALIEHAKASTQRRISYDQMCDPSLWRDDLPPELRATMLAEIDGNGFSSLVQNDHIDQAKIPAGLMLVGDEGVYIMSNGIASPEMVAEKSHVAQCFETDPTLVDADVAYMNKVSIFGGDDGVEFLAIEAIEPHLDREILELDITPEAISIVMAPARNSGPSPV